MEPNTICNAGGFISPDFSSIQSFESAFIGRGIYRLYRGGVVVYVGQATCISGRIHTHYAAREKIFTHFDFTLLPDVSKDALDELEAAEIFRLKPEYNKGIPRTGRHLRLTQIAHRIGVRPMRLQRYVTAKGIECFLGLYDTANFVGVTRESLL